VLRLSNTPLGAIGDQSATPFIDPMSPVISFNTIGFTMLGSGKKAARGLLRETCVRPVYSATPS